MESNWKYSLKLSPLYLLDEICQNYWVHCPKGFWTGLPFNFRLYGQPLQKNACAVKVTKVSLHGVKLFHHFVRVFSWRIINRPILHHLGLNKLSSKLKTLHCICQIKKIHGFEQGLIKPISFFTKKTNVSVTVKSLAIDAPITNLFLGTLDLWEKKYNHSNMI